MPQGYTQSHLLLNPADSVTVIFVQVVLLGVLRQTCRPLKFTAIQGSTQMLNTLLCDTGEMGDESTTHSKSYK